MCGIAGTVGLQDDRILLRMLDAQKPAGQTGGTCYGNQGTGSSWGMIALP